MTSSEALRGWLVDWVENTLAPRDWPAVVEAYTLAQQGKSRELLALDARLTRERRDLEGPGILAARRQLARMRPLRDSRVVQRYLDAVERGEARAWRPLVFGVEAAVFNVPLRSALLAYGTRLLQELIGGAILPLRLNPAAVEAEMAAITARFPSRLPALPGFG